MEFTTTCVWQCSRTFGSKVDTTSSNRENRLVAGCSQGISSCILLQVSQLKIHTPCTALDAVCRMCCHSRRRDLRYHLPTRRATCASRPALRGARYVELRADLHDKPSAARGLSRTRAAHNMPAGYETIASAGLLETVRQQWAHAPGCSTPNWRLR